MDKPACCRVYDPEAAFEGARALYRVGIESCTGCTIVYFLNAPGPAAALLNAQDRLRASFDHQLTCPYLAKP
jgi:hypothetical protein